MGNVASAVNAAYMTNFKPRLLISAGIAGSLDPARAWIGDVVIPTAVYHYRYNKVFDGSQKTGHGLEIFSLGTFLLREDSRQEKLPRQSRAFVTGLGASKENLNAAIGAAPFTGSLAESLEELRVRISTKDEIQLAKRPSPKWVEEFSTFSWEKVLDSMAYAKALPRAAVPSECVCVEMESYGFAEAMKRFVGDDNYTIPLIVRGISDIVGNKARTDQLETGDTPRSSAMHSVARALDFLIFDVEFRGVLSASALAPEQAQ